MQNEPVEEKRKETAGITLLKRELYMGFPFIGVSFPPHVFMLETKIVLYFI